MKFQIIAAAIALSLLASPGCKQLKCGAGTVEEDGECVVPKPPKPKGCGKIVLTKRGIARYTLVKATLKGNQCTLTLKAKDFDKHHFIKCMQYDKDGVKLSEGQMELGELDAGESANMGMFFVKTGTTKIKLHPK